MVELPTVKKIKDIELDVQEGDVVVEVEGLFYLDIPLPYKVDPDKGS